MALVCWAPLVIAAAREPWHKAALLGLFQGALGNALVLYWLVPALTSVARLSLLASLLLFASIMALQGVRSAIMAALVSVGTRRGWTPLLTFPVALVSAELAYPCVVPWYSALFAGGAVPWLQLAEFGGPLAVSAWISVVNAAVAVAWLRRTGRRWARPLLGAAALTLAVTAFGFLRMHAVQQWVARAPLARVGVVQGNLGPAHLERREPVDIYQPASLALVRENPNIDLLVWPETAIFYPTRASELSHFLREFVLRDSALPEKPRLGVPLLTGMALRDDGDAGPHRHGSAPPGRLTNSAVLTSATGRVTGRYDKRQLVPLGEAAIFSGWGGLKPRGAAFSPGLDDAPLKLGTHRLSVSICLEDILHGSFRRAVEHSTPDLLVNLTSDSWFAGSPAANLHLGLAMLRAVEHRRFLLRATTTGVTAAIDPTGTVTWRLPENQLAAGVAPVRWLETVTPYEKLGDTPWWAVVLVGLFLLCVPAKGRLRSADSALDSQLPSGMR